MTEPFQRASNDKDDDSSSSTTTTTPTVGIDGDMSLILEYKQRHRLWVGNRIAASNADFLKSHGITHVANCTSTPSYTSKNNSNNSGTIEKKKDGDSDDDGVSPSSSPSNIHNYFLQLNLEDRPESPSAFYKPQTPMTIDILNKATNFIHRALHGNSSVLVHCEMGQSRSVAVVTAYLATQCSSPTYFTTAATAAATSRTIQSYIQTRCRSVADINIWFQRNLADYIQDLQIRHEQRCRTIERSAATQSWPGMIAYETAKIMSSKVSDLIDDAYDNATAASNTTTSTSLYHQIGSNDIHTMGAVGTDPTTVREALRDGTFHERVYHLFSFFVWIATLSSSSSPKSNIRNKILEKGLSDESTTMSATITTTETYDDDWTALPTIFLKAKEAIVARRAADYDDEDDDDTTTCAVNQIPASELGLQVSIRQRQFWKKNALIDAGRQQQQEQQQNEGSDDDDDDDDDPIPPFIRARLATQLTPIWDRKVMYRTIRSVLPPSSSQVETEDTSDDKYEYDDDGVVEVCGPSTHALSILKLGDVLNIPRDHVVHMAYVYLASIGAHTYGEVAQINDMIPPPATNNTT